MKRGIFLPGCLEHGLAMMRRYVRRYSRYPLWEPSWLRLRRALPVATGPGTASALPGHALAGPGTTVTQVLLPGRDLHFRNSHREWIRDFFHHRETLRILRDGPAPSAAYGPPRMPFLPLPSAMPAWQAPAAGRSAAFPPGAQADVPSRSGQAAPRMLPPPAWRIGAVVPASRLPLPEAAASLRAADTRASQASRETPVSPLIPATPAAPAFSFAPIPPNLAPGRNRAAPPLPADAFAAHAVPAMTPRRPAVPAHGEGGHPGIRPPAYRAIRTQVLPALPQGRRPAASPSAPVPGMAHVIHRLPSFVADEAGFLRPAARPATVHARAEPGAAAPVAAPPMSLRQAPPAPRPAFAYLRREEKAVNLARIEETLRREVEEKLERKVTERVERTVARELAPDAAYARALAEKVCAGLVEDLALEKERLGWD